MSINLKKVTIRNFMSVGAVEQTVKLNGKGLTLVLGENLDTGQSNSRNGVGKTTFVQAISYGLYGEALTSIRMDNLVNNINQKNMLVILEFDVDGKDYRIERGRKPAVFKFFVDGDEFKRPDDDEALGENKNTQAEIIKLIGMSHEMFEQVVALNTYTDPFLKLSTKDQRNIIEELIKVRVLTQKAEALSLVMKQTKDHIKTENTVIETTETANKRVETAIASADAQRMAWDRQHQDKLERIAAEILDTDDVDFDAELKKFDTLDRWNNDRTAFNAQLEQIEQEKSLCMREYAGFIAEAERAQKGLVAEDTQISRLKAEKNKYLEDNSPTFDRQISRTKEEAARKNREALAKDKEAETLAHELLSVVEQLENPSSHTCNACGQGLSGTDHLKKMLEKLESTKTNLENKYTGVVSLAEKLREEETNLLGEIEKIKSQSEADRQQRLEKVSSIDSEISKIAAEQEEQKQAIKETVDEAKRKASLKKSEADALVVKIGDVREQLANLGSKPSLRYETREALHAKLRQRDAKLSELDQVSSLENPHISTIENLRTTLVEIDRSKLDQHMSDLKHQDVLYKLLTKPDSFIRKKIIEQNLSHLNQRLAHYRVMMHLPHEVKCLSDLSVQISHHGRDYDYEQLSRGEMNRLNLAMAWSLRNVWESMNSSLNLMVCDEVIDTGMDEPGAEAALAMLSKMTLEQEKTVFLVSHKENLIGRVNHIMKVVKQNDFATIEYGI